MSEGSKFCGYTVESHFQLSDVMDVQNFDVVKVVVFYVKVKLLALLETYRLFVVGY